MAKAKANKFRAKEKNFTNGRLFSVGDIVDRAELGPKEVNKEWWEAVSVTSDVEVIEESEE